ncbi:MAG: metallophosphoesterase [Lachnospiraceae bacterium]|nr:metallophosphoesterase [Lachnospiraceae bacterium]
MKIFLLIICVLILIVVIFSIVDNKHLVTRIYKIKSEKIDRPLRIAFLSDLHDNKIGRDNCRLTEAVKKACPDVILVGGDMITAHKGCDITDALKFMADIAAIGVPVVYGIGNHEYRMYRYREDYGDTYDKLIDGLRKLGITVTENEKIDLKDIGIEVQGLMIDRKYYARFTPTELTKEALREYIGEYDDSGFRVLLAHNPEYFDTYAGEADLVLSGHVHGGIVRLPFLGGVMSTRLTLFPRYDGGRFDKDGSVMVISRGLGSHTLPFRVMNPVELVIIDIERHDNVN